MSKKIYRSRKDRIVSGVCGGVAEYFQFDSTWVRLAFLFLFLAREVGLLLYIIAWVIIPERPLGSVRGETVYDQDNLPASDSLEDEQTALVTDNQDSEQERASQKNGQNGNKGHRSLGIILVVIGAFFLFDRWIPYYRWERFWPLILVVFGISLLIKGVKGDE